MAQSDREIQAKDIVMEKVPLEISPTALLTKLLKYQREVWRWNVGQYALAPTVIGQTTAINAGGSLVVLNEAHDNGGAILGLVFRVSAVSFELVMELDGQTFTFSGTDADTNEITFPIFPGLNQTRRDIVNNIYAYTWSAGDPRGMYWRKACHITIRNTSASSMNLIRSQAYVKKYLV